MSDSFLSQEEVDAAFGKVEAEMRAALAGRQDPALVIAGLGLIIGLVLTTIGIARSLPFTPHACPHTG